MVTFPGVILVPLNPLTMTLYLSNPMTTIVMIEQVPKTAPKHPYRRHAASTRVFWIFPTKDNVKMSALLTEYSVGPVSVEEKRVDCHRKSL
jgi:hypothetical protein